MAKIRGDLKGVVIIGGKTYRAGDIVPAGVTVGDHVVEAVKDGKASKGSARTAKKPAPDPAVE
ncbi:hypothetical protein [Flaviflexus massiliensis]|uniref:hypothetical protein n=1 Tax=Flaviflexus massiliensis TaxID=1522309 RepID=UPI0006D55294|nr:hypothetical protein [Flaviflexus massiliensis]